VTGSLVSAETRARVREAAVPIALKLGRAGLTPNGLTVIGFAGTCLAAYAALDRAWLITGVLVLFFGAFDLLDGALARATNRVSRLGAFLDSTFDRAGEGIVYVGIAAGCAAVQFGEGVLLAGTALVSSFMVSYVRAKAESLGFSSGTGLMNVGVGPREVRLAILGFGLMLAGLLPGPVWTTDYQPSIDALGHATGGVDVIYTETSGGTVLLLALGLITILATITVIQRILHVRAQAREG